MVRVLEPEDDDAEIWILAGATDLLVQQFGRAEEQAALDVHDRDLRERALLAFAHLGELTLAVEGVFHQVRFAGLAEEKHDRCGGADEDGEVERKTSPHPP